jgi:primosomal protein N' (replication factor Y)
MSNNFTHFEEEVTRFADVILPVPIPKLFTYRIPRIMDDVIRVGARVIVQFGRNRVVTAVVGKIHETPPEKYQAKYLLELLDNEPLITATQLWLFGWIADYYLCNIGEVMNIALPSGLKISSQSRIQPNPDFDQKEILSDDEQKFVSLLEEQVSMTYDDAAKVMTEVNVNAFIKSLIDKQAIILYEEVKEKYQPKRVKKIRLASGFDNIEAVSKLIDDLAKSAKQQEIILEYLRHVPIQQLAHRNKEGISKSLFAKADTSDSSLKTLIKNEILEQNEIIVSRFDEEDEQDLKQIELTSIQQGASESIMERFAEKDIVLLHGITGSGKTEVYVDIIHKVLDSGSQVLFLLPEIALTTQIVLRLKRIFGNKMGVYHSKFSDNERVEVWKGVVEGRYQFVVGVRSAVFLPMENLGLIIVDEEHETSYKQFDPAPRYHARDVAIMIALRQKAKVLLGSATPSMESYYMAQRGRYGLVELNQRYGNAQLPKIELVDLKKERKDKTMKNDFSSGLLSAISENINKNEQTIVFQNRRGYSPYMNCMECNWIGQCDQCAVSLTYHMGSRQLICHYCGYHEPEPRLCPVCNSPRLRTMGVGTEKIEDELNEFFPQAKTLRMDLDTTRTKNAYQQLIGEFQKGEVDILVGTQMISKGLDFGKVSLVGIFDADRMIHFPDFRSSERAFQMLTQVSGRAGRRETPGRVLIQTASPEHPLLKMVIENDYRTFFETEIKERKRYNYPPFTRVIKITTKHTEKAVSLQAAEELARQLAQQMGSERVLGPERAMVERIRNKYLFEVWLKLEKDKLNIKAAKDLVKEKAENLATDKRFKTVRVVINVDAL